MKDGVLLISLAVVVLVGVYLGYTTNVPSACKLPAVAEPAGLVAAPPIEETPMPAINDSGDIGKPCSSDEECSLPMSYAIRSSCPYAMRCANSTCEVYCPFDELDNGTQVVAASDANTTVTVSDYNAPNDTLILFWSIGCPHCAAEKEFLEGIMPKYPDLEVKEYEVTENETNLDLFLAMCAQRNVTCDDVPVTFIDGTTFEKFKDYNGSLTHYVGEPSFVGYQNQIEKAVRRVLGFPADEADMKKWKEDLALRVMPDKAAYVSRDFVNLQLSILSSENVDSCVIRARGVHHSGNYYINDYKRVDLVAGDNKFVLAGQIPACFSCSGFEPGEYDVESWVEFGGEEITLVKLKINVVA
jgi:thiol-disulfide isomerase/thioredoxin